MTTTHTEGKPIAYALPVGGAEICISEALGRRLRLRFEGAKHCIHCNRAVRKTFNQGYCYPCFSRLARCDRCVVQPELCHYAEGTCREPSWGEQHCLIPHTVYLANSSGLKVGITRGLDPIGRWIDQGASEALAIRRVPDRLEAGRAEVTLKTFVSDRTQWRAMLRGAPAPLDLASERDRLMSLCELSLPGEPFEDARQVALEYPVLEYPTKIVSHDFDREPLLEGTLLGIKGQYLILDVAVLNVRRFGGYHVVVNVDDAPATA